MVAVQVEKQWGVVGLKNLVQKHTPIHSKPVCWAAWAHGWHSTSMLVSPPVACSILCARHAFVDSHRSDHSRTPDMDLQHIDLDPIDYSRMIADCWEARRTLVLDTVSVLPLYCMRSDLGMRRWELVIWSCRSRSVFDRSRVLRSMSCSLDTQDKTSRGCDS